MENRSSFSEERRLCAIRFELGWCRWSGKGFLFFELRVLNGEVEYDLKI